MTKYDIIFENLQDQLDSGELTMEDAELLNNIAYEKYSEIEIDEVSYSKFLMECMLDIVHNDLFVEGSNTEFHDIFKSGKKKVKELTKIYKKYMKAGKFDEARKTAKEIKVEIQDMTKQIENLPSSTSSAVITHIADNIITLSKILATCTVGINIATATMLAGGLLSLLLGPVVLVSSFGLAAIPNEKGEPTLVDAAKEIGKGSVKATDKIVKITQFTAIAIATAAVVKNTTNILKSCSQSKEITADNFNLYKLKLIKEMQKLETSADKLIKSVDEAETKVNKLIEDAKKQKANISTKNKK